MLPEDEKTITVARRTKKNLDYIYACKSQNEDVEEFTQLLNSMLGMVICIREDYFVRSHYEWEEIERLHLNSWRPGLQLPGKTASRKSPRLQQINSFSQLVTKIRHAFAHNCFEFIPTKNGKDIAGITVWNIPSGKPNNKENRTWEADILETELRDLANLIVEFLESQLG